MNTPEDPLGCDVALPLRRFYYPMGFAAEIVTNSSAVLEAGHRVWSRWPPVEGNVTASFHIAVCDAVSGRAPGHPVTSGYGHLMSIVLAPDNFAVCDLATGFAYARFTEDIATSGAWLAWHFLEPAICTMIEARHLVPVHASCVALDGKAVLLCGESGAGKTSLAYACARSGWTFLSGDAVEIVRDCGERTVIGRPYEIRFRAASLGLFPDLSRWQPRRRPSGKCDLEIDTQELGLSVAGSARGHAIVFLNRNETSGQAWIRTFPRDEARYRLQTVIRYGDARIRAEQTAALEEFLKLPTLELHYSDLSDADRVLRGLL